MNRKMLVLVSLLLLVFVFFGCSNKTETYTTISGEGDEQVIVTGTTTDDGWCSAGSNWQASVADGTATWVIDKLETSGEYAGYCHVIYTSIIDGEKVIMNYWFDESGDNGYMEMNMNGQTITQEFHN